MIDRMDSDLAAAEYYLDVAIAAARLGTENSLQVVLAAVRCATFALDGVILAAKAQEVEP